jgi:DNA-binding transcriptional ArsR family regulator
MVQYLPIADLCHALGDPTRLAIVERLAGGEAALSELAQPFNMSLTAVQKHVGVLQRAGLVDCGKQGRVRRCRLNPQPLDALSGWLAARRIAWEGRLEALADVLEEPVVPVDDASNA